MKAIIRDVNEVVDVCRSFSGDAEGADEWGIEFFR